MLQQSMSVTFFRSLCGGPDGTGHTLNNQLEPWGGRSDRTEKDGEREIKLKRRSWKRFPSTVVVVGGEVQINLMWPGQGINLENKSGNVTRHWGIWTNRRERMSGSEMSSGKDSRLFGAEIDSSELKNLLLSATEEEQSDYFELEDTMFSLQQNEYLELEDNMFSSFPNNSSSSSSLDQDLPFMGFNFSLCLIPEVILTKCNFSGNKWILICGPFWGI